MNSNIIDLTFPKNGKEITLKPTVTENFINIDNTDYFVGKLDPNYSRNKGAHSFVFALYDAQSYDEDSSPVNAIKISNVWDDIINEKIDINYRNRSFYSEIKALKDCTRKAVNHVVNVSYEGYLKCSKGNKNSSDEVVYPFYIMDYAEYDLKKYLEEKGKDITYKEKIDLCLQLAQGLNELNNLGYYHRDLKPDNIFIFDDGWKIGDLGMVATRDKDNYDGKKNIIGPKGWLSPEPMNKYLCHDANPHFDCNIDNQSDIFQLGKIFWYIIQGNVPIGVIHNSDCLDSHKAIYKVIMHMLQYNKSKRAKNMQVDVIDKLENILYNY